MNRIEVSVSYSDGKRITREIVVSNCTVDELVVLLRSDKLHTRHIEIAAKKLLAAIAIARS
jgi:hypothetical protein